MRTFFIVALLCAACSWDEEKPAIFVQVDGIPAAADHLDVTLTPSDSSVQPKTYRPSFQPGALAGGSIALSFAAPSATGTFSLQIVAADRACPSPCVATSGLASGSITGQAEPAAGSTVNLEVALH